MNHFTTSSVSTLRTASPSPGGLRPRLAFERRERGFGVGYGNSSGYASGRNYAPKPVTTPFRFA